MNVEVTDDDLEDFVLGCVKKLQQKRHYSKRTFEERMFYSAKARAKRLKLEFNVELSDINIPNRCPYTDMPITRYTNCGFKFLSNPSIDRIDPFKGYIKGNIQVISRLANTMKSNVSIQQLCVFAQNVLSMHNDRQH